MLGNIPVLKAREKMDDWLANRIELSPDGIYNATLLATGDEELANDYRVQQAQIDMNRRRGTDG